PDVRSRHESRQRRDGRLESRRRRLRQGRKYRRRRSPREGPRAQGRPRFPDGDLSVHARCVRGEHQRNLRHHPRVWRAGLYERRPIGAIAAAPWGSASILAVSWVYIAAMGAAGLTEATKVAILNANYIAKRLEKYFPTLYQGHGRLVAHECILDLRGFESVTA